MTTQQKIFRGFINIRQCDPKSRLKKGNKDITRLMNVMRRIDSYNINYFNRQNINIKSTIFGFLIQAI